MTKLLQKSKTLTQIVKDNVEYGQLKVKVIMQQCVWVWSKSFD